MTLFASGESKTLATLVAGRDQAIRLDAASLKSDLAAHMAMLSEVRRRAHEFDLIHFHTDMIQFPLFEDMAHRTLTTLHGRLDLKDLPDVYARWPMYPMVSISDDQRRGLPFANYAGTVQHGLPANLLNFSAKGEGYLAFLGRISPEKRPDRAIAIAKAAGMPLKIAAKIDGADKQYFAEVIEPLIAGDPSIEFIGEINEQQKSVFLGGAEALLFPIDWPEPFGLVMIEAMACGAPVIAWRNGSTTEVIEPGETGYLVESLEEAVAAVPKARALDRAAIRARFELRFSAVAMARRYVTLYGDRLASLPYGETDPADSPLNLTEGPDLARIA